MIRWACSHVALHEPLGLQYVAIILTSSKYTDVNLSNLPGSATSCLAERDGASARRTYYARFTVASHAPLCRGGRRATNRHVALQGYLVH